MKTYKCLYLLSMVLIVLGCDILDEDGESIFSNGIDYTQDWVGRYNGAGDIYNATNGTTTRNLSTIVEISKSHDNNISTYITVSNTSVRARGEINSSNNFTISSQSGNIKETIYLSRNSNNIQGTGKRERQRTDGSYELLLEVIINCNKEQ
jgi:hypothetical protein